MEPSLAALQLSAIEERLYRRVVEHPYSALADLASWCETPLPTVRTVVDRLAERKLVTADNDVVEAVDPLDALTALADRLRQRSSAALDELGRVSGDVTALSRRYAERRLGAVSIEKLPGNDAVRTVIASINSRTRTELRNMQRRPAPPASLGEGQRRTAAALARGVEVRSLYAPGALTESHQRDAAEPLQRLGSEIRIGPTPFERLLISDLEFALLKAETDDAEPPTFLIKEPSLVATLAALFDHCWAQATPALEHGRQVSARQLQVLRLLSAGEADASVARACGISPRQLTRDLADLMARTDTTTRFTLAVEAARRGWVSSGPGG